MRFAFTAMLALAIALPAQADESFAQAQSIFMPLTPAPITDNIDGEWLSISTLSGATVGGHGNPELVPSLLERICGDDPAKGYVIATEGEARFTMDVPGSGNLVYTFDWVGGTRFSRGYDAQMLFERLGLDTMDEERRLEMGARALSDTPREVDIYRLDPDTLVISTPRWTEILGRCG